MVAVCCWLGFASELTVHLARRLARMVWAPSLLRRCGGAVRVVPQAVLALGGSYFNVVIAFAWISGSRLSLGT